ncbi:MAG: hypothetical protein MJZ37_00510 [Bacilli bacterium]|nr:hypothetical protein [Bacilli bacterium]
MTEDKLKSRKFSVWITWGVIVLITAIILVIDVCVLKNVPDSMVELFSKVLTYFFYVSLVYLGINVTQKGINAYKEVMSKEKTEEEASE